MSCVVVNEDTEEAKQVEVSEQDEEAMFISP